MSSVKYGIIGCGMIGREHIRNLMLMPEAKIVALADPEQACLDAAQKLVVGEEFNSYNSYVDLLADANVEAVVICTPNYNHFEVLKVAIAKAKHILCEKPLCVSLKQCAAIHNLAAANGNYVLAHSDGLCQSVTAGKKVFYTGMEYRFYPSINRLVKEVRQGVVGDIRMFSIQEHRFPFLSKVGDWNRFALNTGDTLVEKACHFFDLMCHVVQSEPIRIYASGGQDVNHLEEQYNPSTTHIEKDSGAELIVEKNVYDGKTNLVPDILDNAFVTVDFENGVRAMLDLCMFAEASTHQEHLCVTGKKGKVEAFAPAHGEKDQKKAISFVRIGRRNEWQSRNSAPSTENNQPIVDIPAEIDQKLLKAGDHGGATYYEHEAFVAAISCASGFDEEKFVSFQDGVRAVCIGVAANRSIREKRAVDMSEIAAEYAALRSTN